MDANKRLGSEQIYRAVAEKLTSLQPMIRTVWDGENRCDVFCKDKKIMELKISGASLIFPFVYTNDRLSAELQMSLMYNTLLKSAGITSLPNGVDMVKADEYLAAAVFMHQQTEGNFPSYDQEGSPIAPINQIMAITPSVKSAAAAEKPRQSQRKRHNRAARKQEVNRLYKEAKLTISDIAEHLGVSEETVERDLGKRR